MGRIQHYDDDPYSSDSRSASPPSKRERHRKGKSNKKTPAKEPSASPPPKSRRRRKLSASPPPKSRKLSASPPRKRQRDSMVEVEQPSANQLPEPTPKMSGFGNMSMPNASTSVEAPPIFGMPNIAALSSAVGADLGAVRNLAGMVQPGLSVGGGTHSGVGGLPSILPPFSASPITTTQMDFSKPKRDIATVACDVQKSLVTFLMTPENRQVLSEESGAGIEWDPERAKVLLSGSPEQMQRAQRLLMRVRTQCCWGQTEEKVRRLLKPKRVKSVRCRLSPMEGLPPCEKTLNSTHPLIKMGKGGENHIILPNPHKVVSRQHCILEFDEDRGGVYIHDCSTNGTFLNGIKLPSQNSGKVLVSHGDEILFKDPREGRNEFGYVVSLHEIVVEQETKLVAPRRLLTAEEINSRPQEFI